MSKGDSNHTTYASNLFPGLGLAGADDMLLQQFGLGILGMQLPGRELSP